MGARKKSGNYVGVFQREKSETWYYRTKRIENGKAVYYQVSGFDTELEAHKARLYDMFQVEYEDNYNEIITTIYFRHVFEGFLRNKVKSESSRKKYQALYEAQLSHLGNKLMGDMKDSDIDIILLRLSLKQRNKYNQEKDKKQRGYSKGYIDSVRKLIKLIFEYATERAYIHENFTVYFTTKPYKLRLMSLFSGIGAPERALDNMGVEYDLVNYCEIDKKASKAYSLLHNVGESKNLWDVKKMGTDGIRKYPRFDLLIFGFPCQDISSSGPQKGLRDKDGEKTRSGLFFDAMRIAAMELPKFIIAENVASIAYQNHKEDFEDILQTMKNAGYDIYHTKLNSSDFGVPQHRERYFWILVRRDTNLDFKWPAPIPEPQPKEGEQREWAASWFKSKVDKEYHASSTQLLTLENCETRKPNYKRDIISCIKTGWGTPSYTEQTFIQDETGTRCLSSEELMLFQGFEEKDATLLRENGFSKNMVGKMVGNSITVNVMQAILESLFDAL